MVHGVDRDLHIVADDARATPTRCHRAAVGISARDLAVGRGQHLLLVGCELAVCAPAPVTRIFGTVSEACFAGSHSPWPPPLAPPAPQWPKPPCSSASQLLWRSLTSRDRASSATAPRLPDADRRLLPNGRSRDLPVPAQGASAHARVSDHAGSSWRSR